MKKRYKKALKVVSIVVGILLIVFIGFMIKIKSETNNMHPLESKIIVGNITSVKDSYVNMYLIEDEGGYIAIDAGNDIDVISEEFNKLKIDPEKVTTVLLTHSDTDHVAAVELFTNAILYLSSQEEQMIDGRTSRFWIFGNSINSNEYRLIDDRQILIIGNTKIQGIHTPGHTPGSMCYLINDKYLFTGDVLSLENGKIAGFNKIFNMDTETALKSIDKLTNIPGVEWIFTAHYGCTDDYTNAVNSWGK